MTLYSEGKQFTCFDGSNTVPFDWVNDDYCDCRDASDEPGTAACDNGVFTCTNKGYKPVGIRSNRVNDGICDCCDGSDEWRGYTQCNDTCWEFARVAREEAEKRRKLADEGYRTYLEYVRDSQRIRAEKQTRLSELEVQIRQVTEEKADKEATKNRAEEAEREAKSREDASFKERKEESEKLRVLDAFRELDANGDGRLEKAELRDHLEFDIDANGEVSDDEAQEHLDGNDEVDEPIFVEKVWTHVKDIYKPSASASTASEELAKQIDEEREDREQQSGSDSFDDNQSNSNSDSVVYSDETRRLIDVADAARREFEDAEKRLRDAESDAQAARDFLKLDFGSAGEFVVLHGKCFEFTDREYTYKLCPFDRAVQRSSSYSETSLGNWNAWAGSGSNLYSSQRYSGGLSCWNGPERSTNVELECGIENQLTHASEPSRCEYRFVFRTPAACNRPPSAEEEAAPLHDHGEL